MTNAQLDLHTSATDLRSVTEPASPPDAARLMASLSRDRVSLDPPARMKDVASSQQ